MKVLEKLISSIEAELKETVRRTEKELMTLFPSRLSYDLLTGQKRYLSHELDPPWDHSGHLFTKLGDARFTIEQYGKVGDFFEEYTGNSIASFVSGCGLFYETYEEKYEGWMEEQFRDAHNTVLQSKDDEDLSMLTRAAFGVDSFDPNDKDFLVDDLQNTFDELEDFSFLHAENLRMKISAMDLRFVFKLGEKQAKKRIYMEKLRMEQRAKQIELEKAAFNKLWSLLEKKYRLVYQKPFPKRIEMPDYAAFKKFLDDHNVQNWERALIGNYAPISFSNSVTFKLTSPR
ncbi:hypothetical protein MHZ95_17385 [Sporosarcina sp. ACRSM]|uniref:hypothetical protein n=1 Tax=Sporosarcina sp. ACRSM TaxID=2918216 RepID=UPI001EF673DD|nr:hypothetical protein [Sporosarcina sp. ACRSM]MCG7337036.1 hypothetical protein [Sporosarcina sp. ACRSM]